MRSDTKVLRCAVYTRKSTDEGLEKDFNSLDAQREACEAYILSQQHEGWSPIAEHYDDGGFSGGDMERPALRRLLAAVKAGRVDVIVVYKIDRLTRSLADFARIVDILDAADCSFVSVTQSFNTTSSMGRLTLNVLLSFAQFEREVAAERIRDKIAASKKRGMWMGGPLPLGYDAIDRKLVVVPEEAETVRDIMRRYLASEGVPSLVEELERDGVVSKRRKMRDGSTAGGTPFRRGALAHLLSNRVYIGLTTHRGVTYEGQHDAIVDCELFDAVQAKLARRDTERHERTDADAMSVLAGRITDQHGRAMVPAHTRNHDRRYRYYASIPRDGCNEPAVRLPAVQLEQAVATAIVGLLRDPARLGENLRGISDDIRTGAAVAATELASSLAASQGAERKRILHRLDVLLRVSARSIEAEVDLGALLPSSPDKNAQQPLRTRINVPSSLSRCGHEPRLKLEPPAGLPTRQRSALVELITRAFEARDQLLEMDAVAVATMPIRQRRHLERTARLSYLAPDIVRSILDGRQATDLAARNLVRMASLPLDWAAQRHALQLDAN
jgi:DNA invertase Pin-like site-specific DNA recombinase